jgi:hypothetical protein
MEADEKNEETPQILEELEREKEKKLLNLIAEVMVKITLKEFYETGDQISEI